MTSPKLFRSLQIRNYRNFFWGGTVSNVGVWMQRTAQAWAVVVLSHGDGLALGIATFLQFFPTVLLSIATGTLVDRVDKVRLLMVTQGLVGLGSILMAILDGLGILTLGQVWLLAGVMGVVTAFDVARLAGPALAGLLIGISGTPPIFALHAVSSAGTLVALARIDRTELRHVPRSHSERVGLGAGLRQVTGDPVLATLVVLAGVIGLVGANSLQVVLPLVASIMPTLVGFGLALVCCGATFMSFAVLANTSVQLTAEPALLGRVMAVYLTFFLGGGALGAPLLGSSPHHRTAPPGNSLEFPRGNLGDRLRARYRNGRPMKHLDHIFEAAVPSVTEPSPLSGLR